MKEGGLIYKKVKEKENRTQMGRLSDKQHTNFYRNSAAVVAPPVSGHDA
jgi:hypothetical protein